MNKIEDVAVVGGGDAGLLTALILNRTTDNISIEVIDEFDEELPQIGKSTFDHILYILHDLLGIDEREFVQHVRPVWKASVYFQDWCGRGPFHVPFDDYALPPSEPGVRRFEELLYRYKHMEYQTVGSELAERGKSPFRTNGGKINRYNSVAYHLNVNEFNDYLRDCCRKRGIELTDDKITQISTDGERIESVASTNNTYEADLYIDATGFRRALMSSLGNRFNEFPFPLDTALITNLPVDRSEIVPATVVNSGSAGWFWQIDTLDRRDLGYVYSSDHQSKKEAVGEFINTCNESFSPGEVTQYEFDSGAYEQPWMGNCIAVGNALGFVEPLQSTALTLNASLSEKLGTLLADHNGFNHLGIREIYNKVATDIWNNVFDFIAIHYRFSDGDSEFWRDAQSIGTTGSVDAILRSYNRNGFNSHNEFDNSHGPGLRIFNQWSCYRLLRSLGVQSEFYENLSVEVSSDVERAIHQENDSITSRVEDHLTYEETHNLIIGD